MTPVTSLKCYPALLLLLFLFVVCVIAVSRGLQLWHVRLFKTLREVSWSVGHSCRDFLKEIDFQVNVHISGTSLQPAASQSRSFVKWTHADSLSSLYFFHCCQHFISFENSDLKFLVNATFWQRFCLSVCRGHYLKGVGCVAKGQKNCC